MISRSIHGWFFLIFIWLHQVLAVAHRSLICGIRTGSCSVWDLVPWPGVEPGPPTLGAQSFSHCTTREVPIDWWWPFWLMRGWHRIAVFVCISLIITNDEYLFIAYWPSWCLLWRNVYFRLPSIFHSVVCFCLLLNYRSCLYILEIRPSSVASFTNIFSQPVGCLSASFMVSFAM